jgi:protein ImuB
MEWIALLPSHEDERVAWGWWALQFTPRVAWVDEALLLEVSASHQLFGGRKRLLRRLLAPPSIGHAAWAPGQTSLVALALLRHHLRAGKACREVPDGLPLTLLTAAQAHLATLERIGCRTWGELRALPRGGVARRFGAPLLEALAAAYGELPERYCWLTLPESFELKYELAALATSAPELLFCAERLLSQMQIWLQARHRGVLAIELEWTLDLRRLDGKPLPPSERIEVRTAQPTQDMAHLRRLVSEHLGRTTISAPASHLRLRSIETLPWAGASRSFLPEDDRKGEPLHQLVERLSVRLGEHNVLVPRSRSDHRPERMQQFEPARHSLGQGQARLQGCAADALYPTWLLAKPVPLEVHQHVPYFQGPLRRLARLYRVETAWWEGGSPALRDYFIARSEQAGLVWIFRERPLSLADGLEHTREFRWYLQGLYA